MENKLNTVKINEQKLFIKKNDLRL